MATTPGNRPAVVCSGSEATLFAVVVPILLFVLVLGGNGEEESMDLLLEQEEAGQQGGPKGDGWERIVAAPLPILADERVAKRVFDMHVFSRKGFAPERVRSELHPDLKEQFEQDRKRSDGSVAVVVSGDVRTFLCPENRQNLVETIFRPLRNAGYSSIHVFARVRPSVFFGTSLWNVRHCRNSSRYSRVGDSIVPAVEVRKAFSEIEHVCNVTLEIEVEDIDRHDPMKKTLEVFLESIGCQMPLPKALSKNDAYVFFNRHMQWMTVRSAYQLMLDFERKTGYRFTHVIRLRPDLHAFMKSVLETSTERLEIDRPGREHFIIHSGDNSAMMRRHLSDVYFSTFRTYRNACGIIASQAKWGIFVFTNAHDRFALLHAAQYGVMSIRSDTFGLRASRPRACDRLCDVYRPPLLAGH
mmetsp:Transcript_11632/g.28668  ORF Transcript_11632/g.28668 Transcript_11632/m.28668 type:complete len:414 (-) Transcript_11632:66-1307(-)